ncbi:hypothetical protein [Psychrobacter sp. UBA3962]|uniref:hypothetical protein n=1 Tax=Psychrobacter sp. UBA3962 TaxID=1947352 RepID=UPI0025EDFC43|nr:hypothetical protein [Psychrobacter sp. UBA3962]
MSYLIALVRDLNGNTEYPVECFRTDLKPNDEVLVLNKNDVIYRCIVNRVKYLNWDCKKTIYCKISEAISINGAFYPPCIKPIEIGVVSSNSLIDLLKARNWQTLSYGHTTYKLVLTYTNNSRTAFILIRKNGVDLELMSGKFPRLFNRTDTYLNIKKDESLRNFVSVKFVRHHLAHTTFNLFEGIIRFSHSFMNNEVNLDKYFIPVGSSNKQDNVLKQKHETLQVQRRENRKSRSQSLYDQFSIDDSGEPVYLGSGMWIGSDSSLFEK